MSKNIPYCVAYKVTVLPATNHRGTRLKITELDSARKWVLPYDYMYSGPLRQACAFLQECDIVSISQDTIHTSLHLPS
jgi:hypothetical protein